MTWREFQLRKAGYEREQVKKWKRTRMIAYWAGMEGGFDGKKTSIEKFIPLKGDKVKPKISDEHRDSFNKAMQDYKNKVNGNS